MSGTCHIEADAELAAKLIEHLWVTVLETTLSEPAHIREDRRIPAKYLLYVESPLLPDGYNYLRELVLNGDAVKFKPYAET